MEELKKIVKDLITIKEELLSDASDDMVLDCATRIYNSKNIRGEDKADLKPTQKQIELLEKMKVKNIDGLSRREASAIITESIERNKKQRY